LASDCDDGKACTSDECIDQNCQHTLLANAPDGAVCCSSDSQCVDDDPCTQDQCTNNKCDVHHDCCFLEWQEDPMCDDGNPCTPDLCIGGMCRHLGPGQFPPIPTDEGACCVPDSEYWRCDDHDECTLDTCVDNVCVMTQIEGCLPVEPAPEVVEAEAEPEPEPEAEAEPEPNPVEQAVEPAPEPMADVVCEPAEVAEPAPEPQPEVIDALPPDTNPSTCPVSSPEGACLGEATCVYGHRCCGGDFLPSVRCACHQGSWVCVDTGACAPDSGPDASGLDTLTPPVESGPDAAGGDGNGGSGGGGCSWPAGRETSGWPFGMALALALFLVRRRPAR
jgi:hypothetical protein